MLIPLNLSAPPSKMIPRIRLADDNGLLIRWFFFFQLHLIIKFKYNNFHRSLE